MAFVGPGERITPDGRDPHASVHVFGDAHVSVGWRHRFRFQPDGEEAIWVTVDPDGVLVLQN